MNVARAVAVSCVASVVRGRAAMSVRSVRASRQVLGSRLVGLLGDGGCGALVCCALCYSLGVVIQPFVAG